MFDIDFVAGSHGNYLEFILNKLTKGNTFAQSSPFNFLGASHLKDADYKLNRIFFAGHYFQHGGTVNPRVIKITFTEDDLLSLMTISFHRAGNLNIIDDLLHIDTFTKLNNKNHLHMLTNLNSNYAESLSAPLSETNTNCPRYILREFFKFGLIDPDLNGWMQAQKSMMHNSNQSMFLFPFKSFYSIDTFLKELEKVRNFFNLTFIDFDVVQLHSEFLKKQYHTNLKNQCDSIIKDCVARKKDVIIPKLTLLQESYINAAMEKLTGKEMPFLQEHYFTNTSEIIDYLYEI